jgi:hypothetical protein
MKVFRVRINTNEYQRFLPTDESIWESDWLKLNCKPKQATWRQPLVYVADPMKQPGNFIHLCAGGFVVDPIADGALREVLEMAGELLPLSHEGVLYQLVNVVECVNCLDAEKSKWILGKTTSARIRIKEYEFIENRFSESTLFKIPETAGGEVLTVAGMKDPQDEFKAIVEQKELKGILFDELWSNEEAWNSTHR